MELDNNFKGGECLKFDGVDDYVEVPDDNSLDITDAITISVWIYPTMLSADDNQQIFSKGIYYNTPYGIILSNNNHLYFRYDDADSDNITGEYHWLNSSKLNKWYHIVATWDKTKNGGKPKVYIDNNELNYGRNDACTQNLITNSDPISIGGHTNNHFFNGSIDEVLIFSKALTETQIKNLYFQTKSGKL